MNDDLVVTPSLKARRLQVEYGANKVLTELSLSIPSGETTVIIGPNGCGKSTLLKALARLIPLRQGEIHLEDQPLTALSTRHIARRLGILPQAPQAPEDMRVRELVAQGRYPHRRRLSRWNEEDERALSEAMHSTGITALADTRIATLSGGQRQRAWLAMILAQRTSILLLDEPTTWLDIAHQIELLEQLNQLRCEQQKTLIMVLHDLNQACRYATHLIVMKQGEIFAQGTPAEVITAELIEEVFELACLITNDPVAHTPMIIPLGRHKH